MKERICLVVAVRCGSVPVLWVAGVIGGPVWTHTHTKKGGGVFCSLFSSSEQNVQTNLILIGISLKWQQRSCSALTILFSFFESDRKRLNDLFFFLFSFFYVETKSKSASCSISPGWELLMSSVMETSLCLTLFILSLKHTRGRY